MLGKQRAQPGSSDQTTHASHVGWGELFVELFITLLPVSVSVTEVQLYVHLLYFKARNARFLLACCDPLKHVYNSLAQSAKLGVAIQRVRVWHNAQVACMYSSAHCHRYHVPVGATGDCSQYQCPSGSTDHDSRADTPCITCGVGHYVPAGSSGSCFLLQCPLGTTDRDSNSSTPCQVQ